MTADIFQSVVSRSGQFGAAFEHDGSTGYFYLYGRDKVSGDLRISDQIWIANEDFPYSEDDIALSFDPSETKVGLFIEGTLWAVFNLSKGEKFGGSYSANRQPLIPEAEQFKLLN